MLRQIERSFATNYFIILKIFKNLFLIVDFNS